MKNRGCGVVLYLFQRVDQALQMMAVDRTNVVEAQFMKQKSRDHKGLHGVNHVLADLDEARTDARNSEQHRLDFLLKSVIYLTSHDAVQIPRNGANIGRNRHFIVVQDDQQLLLQMARLVDSLERDASGKPSVTDDRHHVVVLMLQVASDSHAQCSGNGSRSVSYIERVENALFAPRKSRNAFILSEGVKLVAA